MDLVLLKKKNVQNPLFNKMIVQKVRQDSLHISY